MESYKLKEQKAQNIKIFNEVADELKVSDAAVRSFIIKTMHCESNGDKNAKIDPERGSATGLYGFTEMTWNNVIAKHKNDPLGNELKPDGRFDPRQQNIAMLYLTMDNKKAMESAGVIPDEVRLYAAHFLGVGGGKAGADKGAVDVIREAGINPNTPIKGFLPDEVLVANGYKNEKDKGVVLTLKNKEELRFEDFKVGDMMNWFGGKMNQPAKYKTENSENYKKDKYGIPESLGEIIIVVLALGAVVKVASSIYNGISNFFSGNSDDKLLPPLATPTASGRHNRHV